MSQLLDKAKEFVADKIAHIPKPEASLTGVSVKNVSRDGVTFHGSVSVTNPYSHDIPICEIAYTLKSAGRVIASGTIPDPGSIRASAATAMEIPTKVPYDVVWSLIKDVGRDWDIDYEWEVKLMLHLPVIGNFSLPLSTKGEMKLPTLSDFI